MALIAKELTYKNRRQLLLDNVSLECQPGELVAIAGANGAGKTTLLKSLSGDIEVQKGSVAYAGLELGGMSAAERARHRAVMPQQTGITFPVLAKDIVRMGLYLTNSRKNQDDIIREVAGRFDIVHLLGRQYQQLSGGERQRVHLARVLGQMLQQDCHAQRYLLLDECSSAMDMAVAHQVFACLRQLTGDGFGIVAIMHDINLASLYADTLVLMKKHRIVYSGSPVALLSREIIADVFGASVHIVPHPHCHRPMVIPEGSACRV